MSTRDVGRGLARERSGGQGTRPFRRQARAATEIHLSGAMP